MSRFRRTYAKGSAQGSNNYPKFQSDQALQRARDADLRVRERHEAIRRADRLDDDFGFRQHEGDEERFGFCYNVSATLVLPERGGGGGGGGQQGSGEQVAAERSALNFYMVAEDGSTFKATCLFRPYFLLYLNTRNPTVIQEVQAHLMRVYEGLIATTGLIYKTDLAQPNHLAGLQQQFLKVEFHNDDDMTAVRRKLQPVIELNKKKQAALEAYHFHAHGGHAQQQQQQQQHGAGGGEGGEGQSDSDDDAPGAATAHMEDMHGPGAGGEGQEAESLQHKSRRRHDSALDVVTDMREYDVPYVERVCIDTGFRAGLWYAVRRIHGTGVCSLEKRAEIMTRPLIKVLAYDIETTKLPLKFPNAEFDSVMMISYMLDEQGYLIVNRQIVSEDIEDFEYTPKADYPGPFIVWNEPDELSVLRRFLNHIREVKPLVFVTYNGDFFDWPFVEDRLAKYGITMTDEIGVWREKSGEFKGRFSVHLDCFHWVKRDSYLPQGSQGLKAVTKAKLKYDPKELDPEEMMPFAQSHPRELAAYSVSDAVATYYLYKKYVHLFIFSLCTIIPMPPSDVLRKGSGTLCEMLLMVEAFEGNIVCPNKQRSEHTKFYNGHLLESETYIGGHVECLESGVFRADLDYDFRMSQEGLTRLIAEVEETLKFVIVSENETALEDCLNFDEVRDEIVAQLTRLHDKPNLKCKPYIYHLDVGAMYPNIILTNRLQPMAIVDAATCAACDFQRPQMKCRRQMQWTWRGKYFPAKRTEYNGIKMQLEFEAVKEDKALKALNLRYTPQSFHELPEAERAARIKARVKSYSHKVYKKYHVEEHRDKTSYICQRENPFYVDTVKAFRDRRYTYKGLTKKWTQKMGDAQRDLEAGVQGAAVALAQAKDMVLLYDSMQLAHKCILNSFYGYVMRKGARWHSMEMAGVVTKTGADIIKDARVLVEEIGRPLELDTDGIWCMLPSTFPDTFKVKTKASEAGDKRPISVNYPCGVLNYRVNKQYTNHQYQTLLDPKRRSYGVTSECSIYFEVDGPYLAMVLPASQHEGENIKKRYAVFNKDGSLAELKGFEIKRRGELKLIKDFQGEVFAKFLLGRTLEECYAIVGERANHWLDVLESRGQDLEDEDVFEIIAESKNMSRQMEEYGDAKSTAITCATRLAQFLGADMIKDKGLACKFIISAKPAGAPTSQRAVPIAIFAAEEAVKRSFLKRWLGDNSLTDFDVRTIIDWQYYATRLGSAIQKIITIPAAMQKVENPVARVEHPDWLRKKLASINDSFQQTKLSSFFQRAQAPNKRGRAAGSTSRRGGSCARSAQPCAGSRR